MINLMKIRPVGVELFHADGRTDGREESTNRVSQFLRTRLKTYEGFMKAEFIFTNQEGQATLKTPLFGYIN
jgi:hypothetical protein